MATKRKHDDFLADMKSALDSGKHSDFTITCQGREWKVHKRIVCPKSGFLEAASRFGKLCSLVWHIRCPKEAAEGKVDLPEDDPEIVEYMLRYMYDGDYRLPSEDAPRPFWIYWNQPSRSASEPHIARANEVTVWKHSRSLARSIHMNWPPIPEISGKRTYEVFPAQTLLRKSIKEQILNEMRSALNAEAQSSRPAPTLPIGFDDIIIHAKLYALADKYLVNGLKDAVLEKFEDCANDSFKGERFYEAAKIVFTTTPDTDAALREVIAAHVYVEKHTYALEANEELRQALETIPDLAEWVKIHEESIESPSNTT